MKILQIIARMNIGGPALHLCQLIEGLRDQYHHEIKLIHGSVAEGEGSMIAEVDQRSIDNYYLAEMSREIAPVKDFFALLKILFLLWKEQPDIIHTHTAKAGMIGRFAGILFPEIKVIHTYHGTVFHGYGYGKTKTAFFLWIEHLFASFTDKIVVLSRSLKEEMVSLSIAKKAKFSTIHLGFDFSSFETASVLDPVDLGFIPSDNRSDCAVIGFVGRLEYVKNPFFVLELAKFAKKKDLHFHFVMVGDGNLRDPLLKAIEQQELGQYVSLLGWRKDVNKLYAAFDCLMMCSNNEGTPVVIMEALASGCPVVSNAVGGIADLIEDGSSGFLLPTPSVELYFDRFSRVLAQKNEMAACAKSHVVESFSIQRMLRNYHSLYRAIRETGRLAV